MKKIMNFILLITLSAVLAACSGHSGGDYMNWDNCGDPYLCDGQPCDSPQCNNDSTCPGPNCPGNQPCPTCNNQPQGDVVDGDVNISIGDDDVTTGDTGSEDVVPEDPPCEPTEGLPAKSDDPCVFDVECGSGKLCVNGECQKSCEADDACPVLQVCNGIFCENEVKLENAECIFDTECGEEIYCVMGWCVPGCDEDQDCGEGEACKQEICQPDTAKVMECACDCDCGEGGTCMYGACFKACESNEDCGGVEMCYANGVCGFAEEILHECDTAADCPCADPCINGFCTGGN